MNLELDLAPDVDAPAKARDALRGLSLSVPPPGYENLLLVLSELVDNAVVHGPGEPIRVRVEQTPDGVIRGEVTDGGRGTIDVERALSEGPGWGLRLVDRLCSRWGVRAGTTDVWFELRPAG